MTGENHLYWHKQGVKKEDRQILHGHKSGIIWFTGLSGSGKSTLANALEGELYKENFSTYLLDGDNIRMGLNRDLSFSNEDRKENIRRIGEVAKLFVDAGCIVLTAFISPFENDRKLVRELVDKDEYIEVYVKCSIETCEKRDPKGLYRRARRGEIKDFTGITSPYEVPVNPDIVIDTETNSLDVNIRRLMKLVREKFGD